MPTRELVEMSDHPSYHSNVDGMQAEEILRKHGGTCYLTRHSKFNNKYVLSVLHEDIPDVQHFGLNINKENPTVISEIEGTDAKFDDIFKLLSFYEHHPVDHDFTTIGKMIVAHGHVSLRGERSNVCLAIFAVLLLQENQVPIKTSFDEQHSIGICPAFRSKISIARFESPPLRELAKFYKCHHKSYITRYLKASVF